MVDKALIEKLRGLREKGAADPSAAREAISTLFEVLKQIAAEDEELKEELEDMDLCMQFEITDGDAKFWVSMRDNKIDYGEGVGPDVTVTLKASQEVMAGILSQQMDATSAYMSGDLVIEGQLQDAMQFSEITGLAGEIIIDMMDE
jgi:putative sterol carrier protein